MRIARAALLTRALSDDLSNTIDRPIIDKTGLNDKYDFIVRWSAVTANSIPDPGATTSDPDIFTAMQEQPGFKLQPANEPVGTIVIDPRNGRIRTRTLPASRTTVLVAVLRGPRS